MLTFIRNEKREERQKKSKRKAKQYRAMTSRIILQPSPPYSLCPFGFFVSKRKPSFGKRIPRYATSPKSCKASRCKNALLEDPPSHLCQARINDCEDSSILIASLLNFPSSDPSLYTPSSCMSLPDLTSSFMFISSFNHSTQAAAS